MQIAVPIFSLTCPYIVTYPFSNAKRRDADGILDPMTATPAEIAVLLAADNVGYEEEAFGESGARAD